ARRAHRGPRRHRRSPRRGHGAAPRRRWPCNRPDHQESLMRFRDLRVKLKLLVAFLLVTVGTAVVGFAALDKMTKIRAATIDIGTNWMPSVSALGKLSTNAEHLRLLHLQYAT